MFAWTGLSVAARGGRVPHCDCLSCKFLPPFDPTRPVFID
ncbi:hypothetical protein CAter282_4175 [Collimonas arenae]|uniref:Uncharacterized protein n=1 Tax=Collimonas arenae TaxID=279058 RepID=A0A127PVW8_9BURK|nr:hypothetical protein CAter10_4545 [Collimonas arenae]AMP11835.1 hypothetical protein CAter282_4175 [Collimonas arenae]